jgi:hypothetical protein
MIADTLQFTIAKITPEGKLTAEIIIFALAAILTWFILRGRN